MIPVAVSSWPCTSPVKTASLAGLQFIAFFASPRICVKIVYPTMSTKNNKTSSAAWLAFFLFVWLTTSSDCWHLGQLMLRVPVHIQSESFWGSWCALLTSLPEGKYRWSFPMVLICKCLVILWVCVWVSWSSEIVESPSPSKKKCGYVAIWDFEPAVSCFRKLMFLGVERLPNVALLLLRLLVLGLTKSSQPCQSRKCHEVHLSLLLCSIYIGAWSWLLCRVCPQIATLSPSVPKNVILLLHRTRIKHCVLFYCCFGLLHSERMKL